ncbi:lipopolysaccharide biosynthesis protein [Mycolicibacterium parafortuitum]|nr:oligosaccharide flippase family protein [Mycolicibacterium parafortuitum]ORB30631.1 hypothetical protein BST38_10125 [Mycolicibacterium parafortuitum]
MSRNRPARNSLTYIGVAAIQRGAPFLLLLVLAALVPVAEFGQFAVLASIYGLLASAATFGMESVAFRGFFTYDSEDRTARFYNTLAKFSFAGPLALGVGISAVLISSSDKPLNIPVGSVIATVAGACLFGAGSTVPLALLRARERVVAYVGVVLPPALIMAGVKFCLCGLFGYGAAGWAVGDLIGGLSAMIIALPFQRRFLTGRNTSRADLKEALRIGIPLLPHVLSGWALNLSDRLVIAAILGTAAAGKFAFAAQLAMIVTVLAVEINRGVLPMYGRVLQDSNPERLRRVVEIQRIVSLLLAAGVAVVGTLIVVTLAPMDYRQSAKLIPILTLASCFYCLYLIPMNHLSVIAGRTSRMAFITGFSAAMNITLNIVLLPFAGIAVAAYSTLISYFALFALTTSYSGNYTGTSWTLRSKMCVGALCTVVVAMVVYTGTLPDA